MKSDNRYHEHRQVCDQCRENPTDLCVEGLTLLTEGATESGVGLPPPGGQHFIDTVRALKSAK
jgi:hypothetical protein